MADEIERKFLISAESIPTYLLSIAEKLQIEQAYLKFPSLDNASLDNAIEMRIRKSNDTYFMTKKIRRSGQLLSRQEDETIISKEKYHALLLQKQGDLIQKTRYEFPLNNHTVELDFYKEKLNGLIVAEIEFKDTVEAKNFVAPDWFGREVTEDASYKNAALAQNGLPGIASGKVYQIALTGGPCGGKSTFVSSCKRTLEEQGYKVISVAEVATEVMGSGIKPWEIPSLAFQTILVNKMLINEKSALLAAQCYQQQGQSVIIFYDRGLCDNKAYCSADVWRQVLANTGLTDEGLRQRYDAVFNIVTSAYGAEDVWEKFSGSNPERYEKTVEQARETEDKTQAAWAGHHYLKIFENDGQGWESKEKRLFNAIYSVIEVKPPIWTERKYLVETPFDLDLFSARYSCVVQSIEQTYLQSKNPTVERRVRKIQSGNDVAYYYTEKEGAGQNRIVREYAPRSEQEYRLLLAQADLSKKTIIKTRFAFTSSNQHFALDIYRSDECPQLKDCSILELKGIEKIEQVFVSPEGLKVVREVTAEKEFTNAALAAFI